MTKKVRQSCRQQLEYAQGGAQPAALNNNFKETDLHPAVIARLVDQTVIVNGPASMLPVSSHSKAQVKKMFGNNRPVTIPSAITGANQRSSRSNNEIEKYTGWFSKAGSSTDDVLYLHNSIMAGHTYAYAILGYTTNFKRGGFRYGIGGSLPIHKRWDLHLQLSTGKLDFKYDSGSVINKEINSKWHQAALKMEWKISETDQASVRAGVQPA